jgi:hypothetical protein
MAIPGGEAGPGLLAQTIVSKHADHLPLYRLERIFHRQGVRFARSTLCDWAATHFSLIASAVRNGLEPFQYLSCLLNELPLLGDKPTIEQLTPYLPNVGRPQTSE